MHKFVGDVTGEWEGAHSPVVVRYIVAMATCFDVSADVPAD